MPSRRHLANAIRALSMDAVQKAKSGHPGAPMGMADIAQVLWADFLSHNPQNPNWANRDRFVLSNGHGSMLLYSLLHLSGYELPIEELKQFRQLHSKTPGHPEYGYAPGIETTTGPLGQGLTNAVGMAIAEKVLGAQFNRDKFTIVDHQTYTFLGDGCLMEGISHEACSLAGTLGLGKLVAFWDDNGISIDGEVEGWFNDDTPKRFEAYGWQVISGLDGHDPEQIRAAIEQAKADTTRPTLICCKTVIGFGSPNKQGKEDCHGAPLGDAEIELVRKELNWPYAPFEIPADVYAAWDAKAKGAADEDAWEVLFAGYQQAYPELAQEFIRRKNNSLPESWGHESAKYIRGLQDNPENIATRKASQNTLNAFGPLLPELLGGSADLAGSNLTIWSGSKGVSKDDASGNYLYYGVREFGMSAMMNGITLYGGFKAYGATFLMFMEYARNAVRMAALMKQPCIFVYTHDSIGLGEDGPTHQPVEQVVSLRATPNLDNWRPCDQVESAIAWKAAIERTDGPTTLIFTRQGLPQQARNAQQLSDVERGGYVLVDSDVVPQIMLIATGSEIHLAVEAAAKLNAEGIPTRVVSMPCTDLFDRQSVEYKETVLPRAVTKRVAVEALAKDTWYKYVGLDGAVVGMDSFGESAPASDLFAYFNITTDAVYNVAKGLK
jgi:transketolase